MEPHTPCTPSSDVKRLAMCFAADPVLKLNFRDLIHELELKDRVVQLTIRNEREEMESGNARRAESEVRKRITGQEGKMQSLKDQVARLSKQLQDSREAALAQLLEASASQLAEKAAEARRFEELLLRQTRRATEAEEAQSTERSGSLRVF
ncbi:hypothetical protein AK812_SmicGene19828 [Symbiodinium microadriaticum]|uniref:Uncharacterized protein n=1 Tax=Symbiodinium microadriaticum TaxID=2951 RepID=A0A1Q9DRH6_SYMMI|nr:hypothetical protein AK812_SmicGene19828 [Symbiodinium microadriaticum]CAE7456889.1 unnamed protein product [Symbiodinium microadriaticum]